jgi:hypothetical protein
MRRTWALIFLGLGTLLGFSAGARSLIYHRHFGWGPAWATHQTRTEALAEACVRAAAGLREAAPPKAP